MIHGAILLCALLGLVHLYCWLMKVKLFQFAIVIGSTLVLCAVTLCIGAGCLCGAYQLLKFCCAP